MTERQISEGMFTPFEVEQIGWYVYALQDPRDRKVFYIGKGMGNRAYAHAMDMQLKDDGGNQKQAIIRSIIRDGLKVVPLIVRHKISSEKEAYTFEAALIDFCHLLDPSVDNNFFQLTNLVRGHDYRTLGIMSAEVLQSLYDAPPCPQIEEPMLLFRIPLKWRPEISPEELFESTHGWWALSPRREQAEYAAAVSNRVIRAIYRIDGWRPRKKGDRDWQKDLERKAIRWGFSGELASEMNHYLNKSVKHLFQRGDRGAARYVNC